MSVEALGTQRRVPSLMTLRGENGDGLDSTQRLLKYLEIAPIAYRVLQLQMLVPKPLAVIALESTQEPGYP